MAPHAAIKPLNDWSKQMSNISLKREYELSGFELDLVTGGGGSADKGTSETVSSKGSGTVSGPAAGLGSERHYDNRVCHKEAA
jgi:hypothetical protein